MVHNVGEDNVLWQVKECGTATAMVKKGEGREWVRKALQMLISLSLDTFLCMVVEIIIWCWSSVRDCVLAGSNAEQAGKG